MTANQIEDHVLQETLEEHPAWEAEEMQDFNKRVMSDIEDLQEVLGIGGKNDC